MSSAIPLMRRNVLIFHSGALGDFIMSWPLALAAGRLFAQSRIVFVTASQKGALAERALRLDSTDVESGWHALFAEQPTRESLDPRAIKWLDGAKLVLSFAATEADRWTANVRRLAEGAQVNCIATKPPVGLPQHVSEFIRDQLGAVAPLQAGIDQMLKSIASRGINGIQSNPMGPIVIHPGSGGEHKRWLIDRFLKLAERLRDAGESVKFILGDAERDRLPQEDKQRLRAFAEPTRPESLVQLYDLIRTAKCYVGNDSGPTHLAGIAGVPTVAVFGTDPTQWRPLGPAVHLVSDASIDSITVDRVMDAITGRQ